MKSYRLLSAILFHLFLCFFAGSASAACTSTPNVSVSVTDCGADPTGVADSGPAFVDAIAKADSVANLSKSVYIPCGTYLINGTTSLTIPSDGFTIEGQVGCAVTVVLPSGDYYSSGLISIPGRADVSIRGFKVMSSGTNRTPVIVATPTASGLLNLKIANMFFKNIGAAALIGPLSPVQPTDGPVDGVTVEGTTVEDNQEVAFYLGNVSNFTFVGNTIKNWGYQNPALGPDAINYDMKANVSNWRVTGNKFLAGTNPGHAMSQGPYHPESEIVGLVVANNEGTTPTGGAAERGAGFAMECSNCQILNNTFTSAAGANANGWYNCLEIYGSSSITVTGNSCNSGLILAGPATQGGPLDKLRITNNTITSTGGLPEIVMGCLNLGSSAGLPSGGGAVRTRTAASNIEIVGNSCNAENVSTAYGVVGIQIGPDADNGLWDSMTNILVADNKVQQYATNEAIRIYVPLTSISNVAVTNNIAPQNVRIIGSAATSSTGNSVTWNDLNTAIPVFDPGTSTGFVNGKNF